jgi:hypothetical protein
MTYFWKKSPLFAAFWKIARPMSGKFSIPSTGIIADHDHAHSGFTTSAGRSRFELHAHNENTIVKCPHLKEPASLQELG